MSLLEGARIALLEARLSSELADLVRREGGVPVCAPAVTEVHVDVRGLLPALIDDMRQRRCEIVVFLTGAGVLAMLDQARTLGLLDALVEAFSSMTTVCRGPKPAAVLRKHGIAVRVNARAPHTTAELLEVLPASLVAGTGMALLHDGGGNSALVDALRARGAWVEEVRSYEWRLPDDVGPIEELVRQLIDGAIDAIAFTNQVQVRHLFEVGVHMHRSAALLHALQHRTVVGSIGPTCSIALQDHGAPPHVVASPTRMRPLVTAVGTYLAAHRAHDSGRQTS
ncbi:MAG: uroporphyrinogen-III synthase [bacterium]